MKNPLAHYVRARLHRRIFVWFGATILLTGLVVGSVMGLTGGEGWSKEVVRARTFVASRFERAWDEPAERDELARALGTELDLDLRVTDARGALLLDIGRCDKPTWRVPVTRGGEALGQVAVCLERHHFSSAKLILGLALAGAIMWACSGWIARRLARPIAEVARVADAIGAGKLDTRVRTGSRHRRHHGEVAALATAINTMATRIEKQFHDQKELLAGVSHEIRTPLARIRLLLELAREKGVDDPSLGEIDREIIEMDALVSELLASSRLDFVALTPSELDPAEAARRALDREGVPADVLVVEANATVRADATLVARALSNLVQNAKTHGAGLTALKVRADEAFVTFTAEDKGAGLAEDELERIFEPFYRGRRASADGGETKDRGSLGLGLALVRRIAEAHGGKAFAGARPGGGARVGFTLARRA